MNVDPQSIPEVLLITPKVFGDARGFFLETFSAQRYTDAGIKHAFVQDNCSRSKKGTLRGLHFQEPQPQGKLVWVPRGAVFDVAVDIRVGSPSYGRHVAATLTAERGEQMFVPRGFAHGFCTLEPDTLVAYKVDNFYAPDADRGIFWADPALAIAWPAAPAEALLSERDQRHPLFAASPSPFAATP